MKLVGFSVDDLDITVSAVTRMADWWGRPTRSKDPNGSWEALRSHEAAAYRTLVQRLYPVLQQARHATVTNVAVTSKASTKPDAENRRSEFEGPQQLVTLSVDDLKHLTFALSSETGHRQGELDKAKRKRPREDAECFRSLSSDLAASEKLSKQIAALYNRSRKRTVVNVVVE